ncbi:MAG: hypothetical protein MJ252_30180, partial [archaeon]|nr:hypothetical protein [archaeon]
YEDKNKKKIFKQFMRNSILSNRNRKADKGKIRKVILKNSLKRLMINALKKLKGEILKENEKKFLIYKAYKAIQNSKTKNKTENSVKSSNVNDSQSVNNEELNKKVKAFKEANKSKTYLQFFNSCLQKSVLHKNKDKIEIIKENNKKKKIKEVFQELRIETKRSLLKKKNKQKLDSEFFNLIIKRKSLYILKDAVITKIFYTELYHGFLNQYLIKSNLRKKTVYLQVVLALNALKKYKRKRKPKKKENVKVNNFIQKEDKKENKQKEDSKISVEEEDNKELIEKETLFKHIVYWRFFKDNVIRARQETLNNLQLKRKIFNALKENMKNSKDLAYYLDEAEANDI